MQAKARIGDGVLTAQQDEVGTLERPRHRRRRAEQVPRLLQSHGGRNARPRHAGRRATGNRGQRERGQFHLAQRAGAAATGGGGTGAGRRSFGRSGSDRRSGRRAFRQDVRQLHPHGRASRVARSRHLQQPHGPHHPGLHRLRARPRRSQRDLRSRLSGQQPRHPHSGGRHAARRGHVTRAFSASITASSDRPAGRR